MSNLVIKISGDIADYETALKMAAEETEALGGRLEQTAKVAGVAFALLTAEAFASVSAFSESQAAANKLTAALQAQGIYSAELVGRYEALAEAIQNKTGTDDDDVIAALASAQTMLGQIEITEDLTLAVANLAQEKGIGLTEAFNLVAKAATVNTSVLKRQGIEVEDTGDKAKNLIAIQEELNRKFGGQAEAALKGLGGIKLLNSTFSGLQEEIGERLAPAFEILISATTRFIAFVKNNSALVTFLTAVGIGAATVTGLALAASLAGLAFLQLKASLLAASIATSAMTVVTRGLLAATGLGLLVTTVALIAMNWDQAWPRITGIFLGAAETIKFAAMGVGNILKGMLTLDVAKFEEGEKQLLGAVRAGVARYNDAVFQGIGAREAAEAAAEKAKKDKNDTETAAREAAERAKAARLLEIEREKRELMVAQISLESQEILKLKQEEISLLEALEDEKNAAIVGKLQNRLERVRELQIQQTAEEVAQNKILDDQILAQNAEFQILSDEQQRTFLEQNNNTLRESILTESTAREQAAQDTLKAQIATHNQFLLNQQKFGTAYAVINRAINSDMVQGAARAFGDLAALQQSSNATLKSIGKAAALANIAIQTARAAMNIYTGFSTIPIVGPALGVAGAAAAVAFGAEQAGKVTAAADGGLLTGGIPGRDSIPVLGMPGELVVPTRNFDEVVNAVASSRGGDGGGARIILELKGELMDFIEAQLVERSNLNLSIQGG